LAHYEALKAEGLKVYGEIMSGKKLHVGIIGAGRIGRVHAETLAFRLPEAQTVAITDINRDAAQALAERCSISNVVSSVDDILGDKTIEAVLICSSTDTHADLIARAAKAGKHIFCEKPIALELDKIDAALAAVKAAGVKLQVGFNRRFDSNFLRVRQAVSSGEIGKPNLMHIISRDPAPPPMAFVRTSGGIFRDMMIHDFDLCGRRSSRGTRIQGGRRPGHGIRRTALQERRNRDHRQQPQGCLWL
jgi:myo-inositol 2-dehydrogenase/D-chiro-inositol 1-dehydrogenase